MGHYDLDNEKPRDRREDIVSLLEAKIIKAVEACEKAESQKFDLISQWAKEQSAFKENTNVYLDSDSGKPKMVYVSEVYGVITYPDSKTVCLEGRAFVQHYGKDGTLKPSRKIVPTGAFAILRKED